MSSVSCNPSPCSKLDYCCRRRNKAAKEVECLRWFTDFEACEKILYEQYFFCEDLGRDLVPVVQAFKDSEACQTKQPKKDYESPTEVNARPFQDDATNTVPMPFNLSHFLESKKDLLVAGRPVALFEQHPCPEFKILALGGKHAFEFEGKETEKDEVETFLYQYKGTSAVSEKGKTDETALEAGCGIVVDAGLDFSINSQREASITLLFQQFPVPSK